MTVLRFILFPFVPVYYLITWCRNRLYDIGIFKSKSYNIPIICVGNLSVGGTGKSPMIEYLVKLLQTNHKMATLSRGYKRETKGFQLADSSATAQKIGDEPFQFYSKFENTIHVAVDADRQHGITKLQSLKNPPDTILLDDAFQHRKVKAGLNILLTTYAHPFYKDIVLPTGNLREPKSGSKRADIIVVTKCPTDLSAENRSNMVRKIKPTKNQHVFFSSIAYAERILGEAGELKIEDLSDFTLVTGIANAKPLVEFLKQQNLNSQHLNFKDHHQFSLKDVAQFSKKDIILTTEKDFMRLKNFEALRDKLYYLPIEVSLFQRNTFDALIKSFVAG